MTLEQLRIFVAVAAREHVTQAARDLHLTQSATSAAIASLEARYAIKLFDRIGRRIELTAAGRLFLGEARSVLARAAAAETLLADLAGLKLGSLTIAASQTVANYWLPPILHLYRERYPGITLTVTIGNTESVSKLVHDGGADVGFVEGAVDDPSLSIQQVGKDQLALVVPPGHAWTKQRSILPAELKSARWVLRERGSGTRAMFEAALSALGLAAQDLDIVLELPSNESVRAAIEAGAGVTVISMLVAASSLKLGALVAIDIGLPARQFFILRHKERYRTQAGRALYELVAEKPKRGSARKPRRS